MGNQPSSQNDDAPTRSVPETSSSLDDSAMTENDESPGVGAPSTPGSTAKKVLIVGAGPAGLLTAIFLLRRNRSHPDAPKYHVTVVDPGVDFGALDSDGLKRHRSWMIGLSCHGLTAIKRVPELYEEYISKLGLSVKHAVTAFGSFKRKLDVKDLNLTQDAFIVDRNYIVAGLARYLSDNYGGSDQFVSHYGTKAVFVDGENHRVLVRDTSTKGGAVEGGEVPEQYLDYDLLIGCDGIRSVVRNAFVSTHRDFEFDLKGLFGTGKSVHIPLPEDVEDGTFMFLVNCVPNGTSFVLPETGKMLNVGIGFQKSRPPHPDLCSKDVKVVSAYFKQHFKAFKLDPDIMAKEWVNQTWNSISMVHCNYYHSDQLQALLLGDAAHATSPQIGQGMNTALADAEALNDILDRFGDDSLDEVLPEFSRERVKEGNALSDLSFYTFSLSPMQQMGLMAQQQFWDSLHRWFPSMFEMFPMSALGAHGMKLSVAYDKMSKLGVIQKVRRNNDKIMRDYFERRVGMVTEERGISIGLLFAGTMAAAIAGVCYVSTSGGRDFPSLL